jgi:predicted N-formylglutamate amidohydrolase
MIEIRNDLIGGEAGQIEWSERLAMVLRQAVSEEGSTSIRAIGAA